ncbi:MAG: TonB-dependent receptor [Bacteroides sp.]|jgi:iron complex outermembrane receptor protein|nr:TonB-dependent receptor [Bacteroides sp.]MCI1680922.1 TonB-dependent receptor [Bacteroides sp.]
MESKICSLFKIEKLVLVAMILLQVIIPVRAQTVQDTTRQIRLDEVMVTAAKVEVPINQTAKFVTVITKDQIAAAPVQSIQELLAYAANVDVIQRGGHGVQADVSIRGGTFDENAVLLNGINVSNAQTGHYSFDFPINLSDIERIEIIHGPAALIYGSSAFSGGINIITKKEVSERLYAKLEGGMHQMGGVELRGTSKVGITTNSMSFGYSSSGGYIANSDYDIYNALWQTRFHLKKDSKLDLQLGYNNRHYGANTFYSAKYPNQYERISNYLGSLKGEFGSALKVIPILFWDRHYDQFDLIKNTDTGRNYHRNDTYGGNLIFLYQSVLGTTSLGGELRREDIMSSLLGKPLSEPHGKYKMYDSRTNTSVTLEHTVNWNRFVVSAGVLLNHNTLLSGEYKFFPSVSVTYKTDDYFSISSSWSKSTRMPTFTDLYYTTETHNGNEGLKPERSESVDLAFKYNTSRVRAYLTGFLQWGRDMIDWVKDDPSETKWSSWNLSTLNTQGLEMGVDFSMGQFLPLLGNSSRLALDYTCMHSKHDAKNLISIYALNYLRDKFTVRFTHPIWKGLSAGWYFRYQKRMGTYERYVDLKKVGDEPYPAFSTLDLNLNYTCKDLLFSLNLNNLYDTHYFDLGNVPQAGFWLSGSVSYILR